MKKEISSLIAQKAWKTVSRYEETNVIKYQIKKRSHNQTWNSAQTMGF